MQTLRAGDDFVGAARKVLRAGGVVAFPTETVYGLCVDALNGEAVKRLYALKGRDAKRACAFLLSSRAAAGRLVRELPPLAGRLADAFWPGPLTLVVPVRRDVFVGMRLPESDVARAIAAAAGTPLLQTSANRSGEPAARDAAGVKAALGERVQLLVDGGPASGGSASTVVRCTNRRLTIQREGAVPSDEILAAASELTLIACTGNLCRSPAAEVILRALVAVQLGCDSRELERYGHRFGSFGTMGLDAHPATDHTVTAARELGFDVSGHASRPFAIGLVREARRIYCLSRNHLGFLAPYFHDRPDDLALLDPDGRDIADPMGRSLGFYRKTVHAILDACIRRAEELVPASS